MENLELEQVEKKVEEELSAVEDMNALQQTKANYLGKKGIIAQMMSNLKDLSI